MLYLIGRPPRVGKTRAAIELSRSLGAGWLSTDALRWTLELAKPDLGRYSRWIRESWSAHADAIAPFLDRLCENMLALADDYILEGVANAPAWAASASSKYNSRACFVGLSSADVPALERGSGAANWLFRLSDEERRLFPAL